MKSSPFNTDESGRIITEFMKDKLWPLVKTVEDLAIKVAKVRLGLWGGFTGSGVTKIEKEYMKVSVEFMASFHLWSTPDELFKGINEKIQGAAFAAVVDDYFKSQGLVKPLFDEGFRLLDYVGNTIAQKRTAVYNRIAIIIAIIAIVISTISVITNATKNNARAGVKQISGTASDGSNQNSIKSRSEVDIDVRQIAATDQQIDKLVYDLYGLTEEEIRIVEMSTKR